MSESESCVGSYYGDVELGYNCAVV